jgi:hypothetical protein
MEITGIIEKVLPLELGVTLLWADWQKAKLYRYE